MLNKDLLTPLLPSLRALTGILALFLSLYFFWRGYETLRPPVQWHLLTKKKFKDWSNCNVKWMNLVLQSWQEAGNQFQTNLPVDLDSLSKNCGIKPNRYIWEE